MISAHPPHVGTDAKASAPICRPPVRLCTSQLDDHFGPIQQVTPFRPTPLQTLPGIMTRLSTIPTAIIPGWNPDPSIVRVGDDYFLATSTFEYFPGIPIYHSKDLVNWDIIGHALNRRSQLDLRRVDAGGGIYAPTLRYHKGRFYLATTCVYSRQGLLASRSGRTCLRESDTQLNETRGFYVSTDNVWDETAWSEPVYFDMVGIDQDVSVASNAASE